MIMHDRIMRHGGLLGFKVLNRGLINSFSVNNQKRLGRCQGLKKRHQEAFAQGYEHKNNQMMLDVSSENLSTSASVSNH